ncbi:hypothetical protein ASE98_19745 [Pseudomonas sp. Leaf48]|uniref:dermonecrotic toxin domain-containing protein n=1 Tax=Pseudomonas sp. Leaf48 TaxID=1736221 RepID=UPI000724193C|nr:DUF6543 domain-containing protein [Pseudomonas sp. Leaf48]KQN53322.1 hypothetical protein ASE98_19745 [Pseudomonas sp. Leaf48]
MNTPVPDPTLSAVAAPAPRMRDELQAALNGSMPQTPADFAKQLFHEKWGRDIDPQTAVLVTLDYNYQGHPPQDGIHQGQIFKSQTLIQALLGNYQKVGDDRFGENAFGLVTPHDIGPSVRIVEHVDEFALRGSGNHSTYEGIYRRAVPQTYGPQTQIALRPADFKHWVWTLELKDLYQAYLDRAWPSDTAITASHAYALRTSVKAAFVMNAFLQRHENSLSQKGLELALQAAGLPAGQTWDKLTFEQMQAATRMPSSIMAGRLEVYRYTATDIWTYRERNGSRILFYIPGNSSPFHEFSDAAQMQRWVVAQGRSEDTRHAVAQHYAENDRTDGNFHAGVLTALEAMAQYPDTHWLTKTAGWFNNDGPWDPAEYIGFEQAGAATDPFAQLVLCIKRAAQAGVETIRDDAQVNRDNLSAFVEPLVQWINRFGALALFVPGGEGLLALAGLIDAGYGLDQAVNGKTANERSEGVTRTVFGLLNALPMAGGAALVEREAADIDDLAKPPRGPGETEAVSSVLEPARPSAVPVPTRVALLRGIGPSVASFSDEMLAQIAKVSAVDDDMLRLMQQGRPLTPLLADTISRFRIDQELGLAGQPELFDSRYRLLQQSGNEWVRLFQQQYPGLPTGAIEQMLDRYGVDIGTAPDVSEARHVFKRLDSKARQYQQHVRLNRAYEGLYLRSVLNPESDTLALHSLDNLPGWPQSLRIDLLDESASGRVLDRIGAPVTTDVRQLIKSEKHYRLRDRKTDLYTALLGLLSDDERSALQLTSRDPASELRLKLADRAMSRSDYMQGLRSMDSKLPFKPQGLRGGGFPQTAQGESMNHEMMRLQLKEVYPEFSSADADQVLQRAGAGAQAHIDGLKQQLQQLHTDLSSWVDQATNDAADMDIDFLVPGEEGTQGLTQAQISARNVAMLQEVIRYEVETRTELADEMIAIWQKRDPEQGSHYSGSHLTGFRMEMDFEDFHRLPTLNVRLLDLSELTMQGFHLFERESLNGFLESFPNLRTLNLQGFDLRLPNIDGELESSLPPAIAQLRHLTSLNLQSTEMRLRESTAGQFCELVQLQTLNLSENPLMVPPVVLGMNELRSLNLRNTRISACPLISMDQPYLNRLDLRANRITRVPPAVINQAISRDRVLLQGNPLSDEDTLLRIVEHRKRTGINLWLSDLGLSHGDVVDWLREGSEEQRQARRLIWERLAARPQGERFLRVLDGLVLTADFRVDYLSLQARVWQLLGQADASEQLWARLTQDVEVAEMDADNPFAIFAALEERARLYRDWVALGQPFPIEH